MVIVGRSNIVGRPLAYLLMDNDATVSICHSMTNSLSDHIKKADIVVVAIGQKEFIKGEWIKEGAIVIDVGIHNLCEEESSFRSRKMVGDVEFEKAIERCSYITPVPGGVGPMTIGKY